MFPQYWLYALYAHTKQANFIELNWNQYGKSHDLLQMIKWEIYFNTDAALYSTQQIAFCMRKESHCEKRKATGTWDGPMPETIKIVRFHYFNSINHIVPTKNLILSLHDFTTNNMRLLSPSTTSKYYIAVRQHRCSHTEHVHPMQCKWNDSISTANHISVRIYTQ